MLQRSLALLILGFLVVSQVYPQQVDSPEPDTLLVLKNGAEVRGVFIELKDGQYTLRLPDGRLMRYPSSDVETMQPISASAAPAPAAKVQSAPAALPFTCQTFITEKDVDKRFYVSIKDIKVSKKVYGSTSEMYGALAEKARKIRADAVINVRTWHSPSGFAWAAPHAGGMAVKLTEAGRKALPNLEGRCY